jgi:hypothetical protein
MPYNFFSLDIGGGGGLKFNPNQPTSTKKILPASQFKEYL